MIAEQALKREYEVAFEPGQNGWIVASVPEIPGALSQGRDLAETRAMMAVAVREVLAWRRAKARRQATSDTKSW